MLIHSGPRVRKWISTCFSNILETGSLPKEFKRAKVIAIPKPGKRPDRVENFRPISLLSVCYKLFERLLYNRLSDKLLSSIPIDQAGFRPQRSCADQVLALTTHIESGFDRGLKTGAVFIDLSAAYDTVWRQGVCYKLLKVLKCNKIVNLINNMLTDRTFRVVLGDDISKERRLKNGLAQGSVLAPLLFNVYISDLPDTSSRKFEYADDIAITAQNKSLQVIQETLTGDLLSLSSFFKKWRLTPNTRKTESSCFHLNNSLANETLDVRFEGTPLPYNKNPKYLGVKLDRTLSFRQHMMDSAAKVRTRSNIIQRLAGTTWGASASTLRTSALSLVFSVAEYCSAVWLNSPHVRVVDTVLNQTMRIISGTIKSTPTYWLPVLSHIEPPNLRRKRALINEYKKVRNNVDLPINADIDGSAFNRLKSRSPAVRTAQRLLSADYDMESAWRAEWSAAAPPEWLPIFSVSAPPPGFDLPRKVWTTLNRVRTRHGRCGDSLCRWGLRSRSDCDCGAERQTIGHIVYDCGNRAFSGSQQDLTLLTPNAIEWLTQLDVNL